MFSYFYFLKHGNKGQIFPVLLAIVVILVIAALISANLGKVSLDRLNTMNAADAGALAGISDFTCAYNKAWVFNLLIIMAYAAVQTWLLLPAPDSACFAPCQFACPSCWSIRDSWAKLARDFNNYLYYAWRGIVRGYSESVRKDAFYYALINAGIDDKFKWDPDEGGYRDKPHPGESWSHWQGLKSAFTKWLEALPPNWDFPLPGDRLTYTTQVSSLSYRWHDNSKEVYITVTSPRADSSRLRMPLLGLYSICIIIPPFIYIIMPGFVLPHGLIFATLLNPDRRYVRVRVERRNSVLLRDLGFWNTIQPNTIAEAEAEIIGGGTVRTTSNDFRLRRIR